MEVTYASWIQEESAHKFDFTGAPTYEGTPVPTGVKPTPPDIKKEGALQEILTVFLEKTKKNFVTPLQLDVVKKYSTYHVDEDMSQVCPTEKGFFKPLWRPMYLKMTSNQFAIYWAVVDWKASEPVIRSDFFRQQSPEPQPNLRTIHIQNTMDSLVPVNDLPLSDLPPLHFENESPEKREIRRRIREARLKVELAKLKTKRMEQKYYERYGETTGESDESSLESSESDSDGAMEKYSYS